MFFFSFFGILQGVIIGLNTSTVAMTLVFLSNSHAARSFIQRYSNLIGLIADGTDSSVSCEEENAWTGEPSVLRARRLESL